eukprot:6511235-Lingulodinium_polyedra.AAC.1
MTRTRTQKTLLAWPRPSSPKPCVRPRSSTKRSLFLPFLASHNWTSGSTRSRAQWLEPAPWQMAKS